jgi:hypothetical protein
MVAGFMPETIPRKAFTVASGVGGEEAGNGRGEITLVLQDGGVGEQVVHLLGLLSPLKMFDSQFNFIHA